MKLNIEDCEFSLGVVGQRIHHKPTGRCVECADPDVSPEDLFDALKRDFQRCEEMGLPSKGVIIIEEREENEEVH